MLTHQIHEDQFFRILWDEQTRIIAIEWKESTAAMTDEQFKMELTLFAGLVEQNKAGRILVDVSKFRHTMSPTVQNWRLENISTRYNAAGIKRFAFLFPPESTIPPMESSPGEAFVTRAFSSFDQATAWLTTPE